MRPWQSNEGCQERGPTGSTEGAAITGRRPCPFCGQAGIEDAAGKCSQCNGRRPPADAGQACVCRADCCYPTCSSGGPPANAHVWSQPSAHADKSRPICCGRDAERHGCLAPASSGWASDNTGPAGVVNTPPDAGEAQDSRGEAGVRRRFVSHNAAAGIHRPRDPGGCPDWHRCPTDNPGVMRGDDEDRFPWQCSDAFPPVGGHEKDYLQPDVGRMWATKPLPMRGRLCPLLVLWHVRSTWVCKQPPGHRK